MPATPTPRLGRATILADWAQARQGMLIELVAWSAVALVFLAISIWGYMEASKVGGTFFVWWGPVVFGGYRAIRTAMRLNAAANEHRRRLALFDNPV